MKTVPVFVVRDLDDAARALRAERDENTCRKDFLPTEFVALGEDLERLERKAAKERQESGRSADGLAGGRGRKNLVESCPKVSTGKTRDKVASAVGVSGRTYEKARAVVLTRIAFEGEKLTQEQFDDLVLEVKARVRP